VSVIYPIILAMIVLFLFLTGAPTQDAFSWPDAPRHALNGAFMLDFFRAMPLRNPAAFAYNYYAQYPALTILFYPPLFYLFLVPFYALFGVSQTSALAAEFVCYVALAVGSYRIARFWLSPTLAFGSTLIFVAAPEVAYWGRQVMLEIPAFALLAWSFYYFLRYLNEDRIKALYAAAVFFVLAMYTKSTVVFAAPVYLILLYRLRGQAMFRQRHYYIIAGLAIVGLVPLAILTLKFGQANVQSVSGIADESVSRLSLGGWTWYAQKLPLQMGWPGFLASIIGLMAVLCNRKQSSALAPMLLWLVVAYVFFSAIDLKLARYTIFLLLPLSIVGVSGITGLLQKWPHAVGAVIAAIGLASLGITYFQRPVQYVAGYREVADYIAGIAPRDSVVAFSGYRDGSFIFAMRTHEERRDLSIVRADKLMLQISVRRGLGVKQNIMSEAEIGQLLDGNGIRFVVAQPGFWNDLEAMRRFNDVLLSNHFQLVRTFPTPANYPSQEQELAVYRNLGRVAKGPIHMNINIPMISKVISGTVGK